MTARRQPTHPMRVTPAMVSAVLTRIDPETGEITETRGVREIRQQLGPVRIVKTSGKPQARAPANAAPLTATLERYLNAPEGIEDEPLSGNTGHSRQRIVAPMTLLPSLMHEQARELAGVPEPARHKTWLDHAFSHDGTQSLRWAMSRYVCDMLVTQQSAKGEGGSRQFGSRVPFTPMQQYALSRIGFVRKRLTPDDRHDLDQFTAMMGAKIAGYEPISMAVFGASHSGQETTRWLNVGNEGVAVGIVIKLSERLYDIYRLMELPQRLLRAAD